MTVVGAVLCGGASRRMGRDKALVEVDGVPMARRVADALLAGGCAMVLAIGGDGPALEALGLDVVADRWPGEGPLGGVATALGAAPEGDVVVVAPCDWVAPSPEVVRMLLAAGPAAHPVIEGRAQWLPCTLTASPRLTAAAASLVDGGARRLSALAGLVGDAVAVPLGVAAVADADTPADLP